MDSYPHVASWKPSTGPLKSPDRKLGGAISEEAGGGLEVPHGRRMWV